MPMGTRVSYTPTYVYVRYHTYVFQWETLIPNRIASIQRHTSFFLQRVTLCCKLACGDGLRAASFRLFSSRHIGSDDDVIEVCLLSSSSRLRIIHTEHIILYIESHSLMWARTSTRYRREKLFELFNSSRSNWTLQNRLNYSKLSWGISQWTEVIQNQLNSSHKQSMEFTQNQMMDENETFIRKTPDRLLQWYATELM